jgi:heptosyltransferase-2
MLIAGDVGDVLRTTPTIKAVRHRFPSAFLAALVSERGVAALDRCPFLDEVIKRPVSHATVNRSRHIRNKIVQFGATWRRLFGRFDLVISLLGPESSGPLWNLVAYCARAPKRIGFDVHGTGRLLSLNLGPTDGYKSDEDRYARLLEALDAIDPAPDPYMEIWPSEDDRRYALALLEEHGIFSEDLVVAICPGSDWSCQQWPLDRWGKVVDHLAEHHNARFIVVGVEREKHLASGLAQQARYPTVDLTGKTSLGQVAAVLERCQLALTLESAPCAIALAVGAPTVALFGSMPVWISGQHRGRAIGLRDYPIQDPSWFTRCKLAKMSRAVHRCESHVCTGGDGLEFLTYRTVIKWSETFLKHPSPVEIA